MIHMEVIKDPQVTLRSKLSICVPLCCCSVQSFLLLVVCSGVALLFKFSLLTSCIFYKNENWYNILTFYQKKYIKIKIVYMFHVSLYSLALRDASLYCWFLPHCFPSPPISAPSYHTIVSDSVTIFVRRFQSIFTHMVIGRIVIMLTLVSVIHLVIYSWFYTLLNS